MWGPFGRRGSFAPPSHMAAVNKIAADVRGVGSMEELKERIIRRKVRELSLEEVNALLDKVRDEKRMGDESLAHRLGLSRSTLTKWRSGETSPSPRNQRKLQSLINDNEATSGDVLATVRVSGAGLSALIHYIQNSHKEIDQAFCIEILRQY